MIYRLLGAGTVVMFTSLFAISASAIPITGTMEFTAKGNFLCSDGATTSPDNCADSTNPAVGFDFKQDDFSGTTEGTGNNGDGFLDPGEETGDVSVANQDVLDIIGGNSSDGILEVFDFDVRSLPAFEWVDAAQGLPNAWLLKFQLVTGAESDNSESSQRDLAGQGLLSLVCLDDGCNENDHSFETTSAFWTLSNAGELTVSGAAVPEPGPLGLVGLGLIIWGISRRRLRGTTG